LGTWLGSAVVFAPSGTALRLRKGQGLLLNLHYINTKETNMEGTAYFDIKMVPAKDNPGTRLASIFAANNTDIDVAPHAQGSSSVDCPVQAPMDVVMASNHMHEWGQSATTSIVRAGSGEVEVLRHDPTWASDSQLNPPFQRWTVEAPFRVNPGDKIRTACSWDNTSDAALKFPREMCISALFMLLPPGQIDTPGVCQSGVWMATGTH
jgi:hypothetical protein